MPQHQKTSRAKLRRTQYTPFCFCVRVACGFAARACRGFDSLAGFGCIGIWLICLLLRIGSWFPTFSKVVAPWLQPSRNRWWHTTCRCRDQTKISQLCIALVQVFHLQEILNSVSLLHWMNRLVMLFKLCGMVVKLALQFVKLCTFYVWHTVTWQHITPTKTKLKTWLKSMRIMRLTTTMLVEIVLCSWLWEMQANKTCIEVEVSLES